MFEVLSTSGDTHLGGDDFDKRIVDYLAEDFRKSEGMDLRKDRQVRGHPAGFACTGQTRCLAWCLSRSFYPAACLLGSCVATSTL